MRLELLDGDKKLVCSLNDDEATLEDCGVCTGMNIHVSHTKGRSMVFINNGIIFNGLSLVLYSGLFFGILIFWFLCLTNFYTQKSKNLYG